VEIARRFLSQTLPLRLAGSDGFVLWTFTITLFTSALLLFSVQPMFARMVLPKLGGSPSVWAVAMCFFQAALLCGYCYAHLIGRHLRAAVGAALHLTVCLAAFLLLPIALPESFAEPGAGDAYLWLFALFTVAIGLPFFAVSANAPLLQAWFSRTGHPQARDPYFLYGASNVGSLVALIGYPLLAEPNIGLLAQSDLWTIGYGLLVALIALSAALMLRSAPAATPVEAEAALERVPVAWATRGRWILLAFVPSGLLVAFTTHLATDVASAPFLWVGPLVLYLLTYVIVFRDPPLVSDRWMRALQPVAVLGAMAIILGQPKLHIGLLIGIGTLAFFTTALVLHRQLYETRPPVSHLTEFYLWMSFGGVLGGIFTALIAPHAFTEVVEYPLLLVLGLLIRSDVLGSAPVRAVRASPRAAALLAVVAAIVAVLVGEAMTETGYRFGRVAAVSALAVAVWAAWRSGKPVVAIAAVPLLVAAIAPPRVIELVTDRSFFGVYRVAETPDREFRMLIHGTTNHGAQRIGATAEKPQPITYYYPQGPMAAAIRAVQGLRGQADSGPRFGIVGLGTGALACYAEPGDDWRFYEIDPLVVDIARNPKYFDYLTQCPPSSGVVVGDGRLTLEKEPDGAFDMLLVDAFSSDAIPVHLLTIEAMRVYLSKLKPDGVLVLHLTNRHLELTRIAEAAVAEIGGLKGLLFRDRPEQRRGFDRSGTDVMLVTRADDMFDALASDPRATSLGPARTRAWTDDFSDVLGALLAGHGR